jgi:predicted nucleic acid-binding Zn ribbon protein
MTAISVPLFQSAPPKSETTCVPVLYRVECRVPTYIYETTDASKPIRSFEVIQSVHDDALHVDPKTGEAARRVISAGYGILVRGGSIGPSVGSVGSH